MKLTPTDIEAIAAAVVRHMKAADERHLDQAYLVTLPVAERKRLAREEMKREDQAKKAAGRC